MQASHNICSATQHSRLVVAFTLTSLPTPIHPIGVPAALYGPETAILTWAGRQLDNRRCFIMADNNIKQLEELFNRKLDPIHKELIGVNDRLDLVAAHLAKVDEKLNTVDQHLGRVEHIQTEHTARLERIERQEVSQTDRLDKHGARIEALEFKTGHLPPRS